MDAKSEQAGERRFWSRWTIGVGVALLLALVAIVCALSYDASLVRRVKELTDMLDRTQPDWQDPHSKLPPLPASRDSMLVVRRAKLVLPAKWAYEIDANEKSNLDSCPPPCRLLEQDRKDLAAVMKSSAAALAAARVLREMPEGRFDPRLPEAERDQTLGDLREIGMMLKYSGIDAVERGDFAEVWQTCRAQINLCKPLQEGNSWVAVERMGLARRTISNVERIVAHSESADEDLATMQSALAEEAATDLVFPFVRYDQAELVRILDELIDGKRSLEAELKKLGKSVDPADTWEAKFHQRFPRWMLLELKTQSLERMIAFDSIKTQHGFSRVKAIEELWNKLGSGIEPLLFDLRMRHHSIDLEQRTHARLGCAEVGLAAERFRRKQGRWPATPNELVDQGLLKRVPEDPIDGKPLRMRLFPGGLVVYSIGIPRHEYDGTWYDDVSKYTGDDPLPGNFSEFRLWNPDRRHQPPIPPRKKVDDDAPPPE